MFKRLFGRSQGPEDLVSACKGKDRQKFAELFGRAQIFCISLPQGLEKGLDPKILQEELLEKSELQSKTSRSRTDSSRFVMQGAPKSECPSSLIKV